MAAFFPPISFLYDPLSRSRLETGNEKAVMLSTLQRFSVSVAAATSICISSSSGVMGDCKDSVFRLLLLRGSMYFVQSGVMGDDGVQVFEMYDQGCWILFVFFHWSVFISPVS